MTDGRAPSRTARWRGLVGLAARRAVVRARWTETGQTALSVGGIAVAIAMMLLVTSIALGLAQTPAVVDEGIDYTIEPAGGASSSVVAVGEARLGRVHPVAERLNARDDVTYATPVLLSLTALQPADGEPRSILVIGVVPAQGSGTVVGLPTAPLAPGDPFYANGSYDGPWTGELVLSASGAERLGATAGDRLVPRGADENRSFVVSTVSGARRAGLGQFPVAIVHLAELQAVTGGASGDVADQILVDATEDIEPTLAAIYPRSNVVTRGELFGGNDSGVQLPLAISAAAFIVSVTVGTLFLVTTMGFELAATRRERAVLAALGLSRTSRAALIALHALVVAGLGGLLGVGLWLVGVGLTNVFVTRWLTEVPLAVARPVLAGYGLGVALLIGLLTVPYLLVLSHRSDLTAALPI